jgi:hypothetical protein
MYRVSSLEAAGMDGANRGIAVTGLAFVVLFLAGLLLLGELFGAFADSDAFFVAYFATDDHQVRDLVGGHLFVVAALALLLFLRQLTHALRILGGAHPSLDAAQASGLIAVTLLLAGAAVVMTGTMADVLGRITDDDPLTSPAVALAPQLGYVLVFFPAMWAMAVTVALITWASWRAGIWPAGLRWLSVVAIVLLPTSWLTFMPIVFLPVWVLGVTFWAWRLRRLDQRDGAKTPSQMAI